MIKIQNHFDTYPDIAQLFLQIDSGALILLLDRDLIISGDIQTDEIKKFICFLRPVSIFSSSDNLKKLFLKFEEVNVLICERPNTILGSKRFCDELSSREIYDILDVDEFVLPPYDKFATDYCRRLNHGKIKVFAKKDKCAAITLETDNYRMLMGIASKQRGLGGALLGYAASGDKPVLCVARDELVPFYIKFGFVPLYKAGYWRK
ncbi:MAG: hypothetical protein J5659_06605 [Clostridia bacterium]|nr:hypothetical protein [Clostridia bacterium]